MEVEDHLRQPGATAYSQQRKINFCTCAGTLEQEGSRANSHSIIARPTNQQQEILALPVVSFIENALLVKILLTRAMTHSRRWFLLHSSGTKFERYQAIWTILSLSSWGNLVRSESKRHRSRTTFDLWTPNIVWNNVNHNEYRWMPSRRRCRSEPNSFLNDTRWMLESLETKQTPYTLYCYRSSQYC